MATQVTVNAGQGSTQVTVITGEGSTSYKVEAGSRGPTGATGATGTNGTNGAAGPNTITTSTTSNLTGFIAANGTAVSGATAGATAATANTLVLRDATGGAYFGDINASSVAVDNASMTGVSGNGIFEGVAGFSTNGIGSSALSTNGTGLIATTDAGTYHAEFGNTGIPSIDQSFVARVKGAFGWIRGAFTGRIHPPDTLTTNCTYTLPDKSGTVAMIDAETHTGAHAFSSTTRPTSAGTGTPAATSLITRADGDARYANFLYYKVSSALSATSTSKVFDTTTLTIPVGTYEVQVHGRAIYNGSNGGWSFGVERASGNTGTASALIFGHTGSSGIFNNLGGAYSNPVFNLFSGNAILAASGSATSLHRTGHCTSSGLLVVTSELVVVWYVAQVATDAVNPTTLNENSFLLLKKIA